MSVFMKHTLKIVNYVILLRYESFQISILNCECTLPLKMPSKWENCAHNDLIWFFQHNNLPTFEQWLWTFLADYLAYLSYNVDYLNVST